MICKLENKSTSATNYSHIITTYVIMENLSDKNINDTSKSAVT